MDETMPIPVTTTRLMIASPCITLQCERQSPTRIDRPMNGTLQITFPVALRQVVLLEQPDLQVLGAIDNLAIGRKPPIGDPQHQL